MRNKTLFAWKKLCGFLAGMTLLAGCNDLPLSLAIVPPENQNPAPSARPSASAAPSATPVASTRPRPVPSESPPAGPLCQQRLQCIVENTSDNALRKTTQESINLLFTLAEPEFSQICEAKALELVKRAPECAK